MKSSLSAFWLNETSMLTFPVPRNAKQDILSPYFECKMDEIYEIGHSDANLSLLRQPCMVKKLFRRIFRVFSLWFTQMHHIASNKGYRTTFTFLCTDFGSSDNRIFVLSCSYWSRSYYSGAIRSKEQQITNLGHLFHLNLIISSFFFPKYAQWPVDHANFLHSGLKCEAPGKGHNRFIANGCQPQKSRLSYRALLYKNEIWSDLDFWHTTCPLYLQHFL